MNVVGSLLARTRLAGKSAKSRVTHNMFVNRVIFEWILLGFICGLRD